MQWQRTRESIDDAQRFAFSDLVLTLVFATYAFFLVPSLLVFGRLSDRVGRDR